MHFTVLICSAGTVDEILMPSIFLQDGTFHTPSFLCRTFAGNFMV